MISGTIRVIVFPIMQTFRNFTISMLYDGQDNQPVSNLHNSNKLCRKTRRKTFYFAYNYPLFNKIIRDEGEMFQNSTSTPSSNVTRSSPWKEMVGRRIVAQVPQFRFTIRPQRSSRVNARQACTSGPR